MATMLHQHAVPDNVRTRDRQTDTHTETRLIFYQLPLEAISVTIKRLSGFDGHR